MISFDFPLCIVAHDAGGANLIAGLIEHLPVSDLTFCVQGPAIDIFRSYFPGFINLTLSSAMDPARVVLSGTSRVSELEHQARSLAKKINIPSVTVIDHWVNYEMRFERHGEQVLPSEIWVCDQYAYELATKYFPRTSIMQIENRYLKKMLREIGPVARHECLKILYVLEPIVQSWGDEDRPGEFQALDYFVNSLPKLFPGRKVDITLRPHPSENAGKYTEWVSKNSKFDIRLDSFSTLVALISCSEVVVGCESYAMVLALSSGRRTLSSLPPYAPSCRLPHDGIEQIRKLNDHPAQTE